MSEQNTEKPEVIELTTDDDTTGEGLTEDSLNDQEDSTDTQEDSEQEQEDAVNDQEDGDTFPRSYVEKLRKENADNRAAAKRANDYRAALWELRVSQMGKLADPRDLPMPEGADPLDVEQVVTAVDALLADKPHLASRVPRGDAGQGVKEEPNAFSLTEMIRAAS